MTWPFLALLLLSSCAATHTARPHAPPVAPADLGLEKFRGPTLLVVWASWCGPCAREAPQIARLAREYAGRLAVVGITVDDDPARARAFAERHGLPYASLPDPDLRLCDRLGVSGTPALVLLDANGREVARGQRLHHLAEALGALAPRPPAEEPVSRSTTLMGTSIDLLVMTDDAPAAEAAIDEALAEMARVESVFTTWRPTSPISRLNQAGGRPQPLPAEALTLLSQALELCRTTGGAFDVTFKGAARVWDFTGAAPVPPSPEAARAAMARVDCRKVHLDPARGTVQIPVGMAVGLGGIAKGYAVDRAAAVLSQAGLRNFVVNAGGDLLARGRYRGRRWRVGIRHPREADRPLAVLPVSGYAVATSGDYERYFEHQGRRYHHILDPATGFPAAGCQSVTVLAPQAALADALATGLFVMGARRALALVDRLPEVEALIVDAQGAVHRSAGLQLSLRAAAPHASR